MGFPIRIMVAPDLYFEVKQISFRGKYRGKLGMIDLKKRIIFIEKNQPEAGKYNILIHEIIHLADIKNISNKLYKKGLSEPQATYLSANLFRMLAYSGLLKGVTPGMLKQFDEYLSKSVQVMEK